MIANPSLQHHHSHDSSSYRSSSRSRRSTTPRAQRAAELGDFSSSSSSSSNNNHNSTTRSHAPASASASASVSASESTSTPVPAGHETAHVSATGGASRFPSPPPSSSPAAATGPAYADDAKSSSMASDARDSGPLGHASRPNPISHNPSAQQPSPASDDFQIANPPYPLSSASSQPPEQTVIHIRDLAHIQSLASADLLSGNDGSGILNDPPLQQMKYEISGMPIGDIIEMVAALLTKITTTNDLQHDAMQRNVAHQQQANQSGDTSGNSISSLNHSVLAFHGKNVPAITILSYLSRIHKYCPTTYEVFLSLLVYFDRMTERVNDMVTKNEESRRQAQPQQPSTASPQDTRMDMDESDSDLADDDDEEMADSTRPSRTSSHRGAATPTEHAAIAAATYFVVDSFNIHRLIISGVTCASKFFSDVFYTNSRYAKVGGLPLVELNHLELQFLLLNDFRLAVPVEDLEAYATMLVEFYAREVVAKQAGPGSTE
ncbi:putative PCL7-cyclin like protein interacting with Pho85p [Fusarium austroafricanum]|uniref:Putative PCL7-cyclin like protein interacting with Pho85p n=1 Tax=Fusarium austroafricanum TaxID=2364996 RepID=A0A8H4KAM7_9HYPO|nr:putative PCL7-cyclin like protein interacting with Pho85p [Fusarium austroafricanum]